MIRELEPEMDNFHDAASSKEVYRSAICIPSFSHAVNLDFETRDVEGQFVTPEGVLKHKILSSISAEAAAGATGQLYPAQGVVGMAGVGKTIALQGLASDRDICQRFPDGIPYISLGQEATDQTTVQENCESYGNDRCFCKCRQGWKTQPQSKRR